MKKKILFIISNMESGGVSKSMSNLLNTIDTNTYDVDCFILSPKGIFMNTIPKDISIISDNRTSLIFASSPKNLKKLIKNGYLFDSLIRLIVGILMLFNKGWGAWLLSKRIYKINKEYDLAVDFNGQHQLYYLIDQVKAKKKVTFFHSDYEKWSYYYNMDKKYMPKTDAIFTISDQCVKSLKKFFPESKKKVALFENISSIQYIQKMSKEIIDDDKWILNKEYLKLITIGHISKKKGTDLAIKAASILKSKGLKFKWYFIGKNLNPNLFQNLRTQFELENEIVFLGLKSNPYPYINQSDIVVHPSLFEGKSIALDEAKILCKPIVVTNFSTVHDQFIDNFNASICEMTPSSIADKIIELNNNNLLKEKYVNNLINKNISNEKEIEKLYKLIKK